MMMFARLLVCMCTVMYEVSSKQMISIVNTKAVDAYSLSSIDCSCSVSPPLISFTCGNDIHYGLIGKLLNTTTIEKSADDVGKTLILVVCIVLYIV